MPVLPPENLDQFIRDPAATRRDRMMMESPPVMGLPSDQMRIREDGRPREPKILPRVQEETNKWVSRSNMDAERQLRLKRRAIKAKELLTPHRLLPGAELPDSMQVDSDQRLVRIPFIHRYMFQACAQTMRGMMGAEWKPVDLVKPPPGVVDRGYENAKRFGQSLEIIVANLMDEQDWDRVIYRMLQHAWCYPIPVLKVTWVNRTEPGPGRPGRQPAGDLKAMTDQLAQLYRQARRGEITPQDPQWAEMVTLRDTIQQAGEELLPTIKYGVSLGVIRPGSFLVDPAVDDYLDFYQAQWMGDEYYMTRAEIREAFPFRYLDPSQGDPEDVANGFLPFEGVFPDHLPDTAPSHYSKRPDAVRASFVDGMQSDVENEVNENARLGGQDDSRIWVREIWIRKLGVVRTYVKGIEYPVREVRYPNLTKNFYPYVYFPLFDIPGELEQASPVEMAGPVQTRANWKATDGEIARNLSIARGFYAKDLLDPDDTANIENQPAGQWTGIRFPPQVDDIRKVFFQNSWNMQAEVFDTTADELNLAQVMGTSQASTGKVGNSRFAAEVHEQARGEAASSTWIQGRCSDFDARVRTMVAELALLNLTQVQARQLAGEFVFWPRVLSQAEAESKVAKIRQQAWNQTLQELLPTAGEAVFSDVGGPDLLAELEATGQAVYQQYLMDGLLDEFGLDEPLTRESLFRRLRAKPRSYTDKQAYMDQKVILLRLLYDMVSANPSANVTPLLRQIAAMLGEPDALDEVLLPDVMRSVLQIQEAITKGIPVPPEAVQALVALAQQLMGPPQGLPPQAPPEDQPQPAAPPGEPGAPGVAPMAPTAGGGQQPGTTQPTPGAV